MLNKLLRTDMILLVAFLAVSYAVVGYTIVSSAAYIGGFGATLMGVSAIVCLVALTICFIVVALHLKNNKEEVYKGEIENEE